mgnify:CR=1 FL=1
MGKVIMSGIVPNLTTPIVVDSILNNNSWETIKKISDSGTGSNYWSVGDRKEVVLNGTVGHLTLSNYTTYAFIIGFNHNAELEGNNRIHFQLAKTALSGGVDVAFCDSRYDGSVSETGYFSMNSSNVNTGGWASSQMRTNICGTSLSSYSGTIIAVIPATLRAVLKSVVKYTDNIGGRKVTEGAVTATTDYFFLLAPYEVFGVIEPNDANPAELDKQKQYAYYSAGNSTYKYNHNSTTSSVWWWLRSPIVNDVNNNRYFTIVTNTGVNSASNAYASQGLAPAFCV